MQQRRYSVHMQQKKTNLTYSTEPILEQQIERKYLAFVNHTESLDLSPQDNAMNVLRESEHTNKQAVSWNFFNFIKCDGCFRVSMRVKSL